MYLFLIFSFSRQNMGEFFVPIFRDQHLTLLGKKVYFWQERKLEKPMSRRCLKKHQVGLEFFDPIN